MPRIDYAQAHVSAEWDSIWSAREVSSEAQNIDRRSALFRMVEAVLAEVPPGGLVLEGGCGLGRWLLYCRGKYNIFGLERSQPALRALKENSPDIPTVCGDVFHLPVKSGSVDLYLSFGVLEHFQGGPAEGLREAYRVLRPGSTLLITGPGYSLFSLAEGLQELSRKPLVRRLFHKPPIEKGDHFFQYRFRLAEMRRFLKETGFEILRVETWGNLETLWQYIPPLRHPETRGFRFYYEVVMSGTAQRLTGLGMGLHAVVRRVAPWLFAYAWAIRAAKPQTAPSESAAATAGEGDAPQADSERVGQHDLR